MKRKELLRRLAEAGYEFKEGGSHTKACRDGRVVTVIPRHAEVSDMTAKRILKDAGIK